MHRFAAVFGSLLAPSVPDGQAARLVLRRFPRIVQKCMEQQAVDVSGRAIAVGAASAGGRLRPIHLSLVRADGADRRTAAPTVFESFRYLDLAVGVTAMLLVDGLAGTGARAPAPLVEMTFTLRELLLIVAGAAAWPVLFGTFGLYAAERARTPADEAVGVLIGSALALMIGMALVVVLSPADWASARSGTLPLLWLVLGALALCGRWLRRCVRRSPARRRVLIVGSGPRAHRLSHRLEARADGCVQVLGFVDDPHDAAPEEIRHRVLGSLSELARVVVTSDADEVFIALPFRSLHAESGRVVSLCARMGVPCRHLIDGPDAVRSGAASAPAGIASMRLEPQPSTQWSVAKRATDVVGALLGLVILSPVFAAIALAIRLTSRGPILFLQERFGRGRRTFRMVKFRTMRVDAEALLPQLEALNEANGPIFKIRNDPRVTPVGRFLRRWSLDELPQLVNVLFGDMTLVGPRPMSRRDVHRLDAPDALRRFTVTPGLTGLWQVSSRDSLDFEEWVEHDLDYIDRWSPRLELGILARTLPTVLRGVGSV